MFNPYYNPQPNNYPNPSTLTRVTGIEGAKAYQMAANSIVALFDSNDDIFYVKSTDGAGFPTIRTFRFQEEITQPTPNSFDQLKKELQDYVKQLISEQQSESANAVS